MKFEIIRVEDKRVLETTDNPKDVARRSSWWKKLGHIVRVKKVPDTNWYDRERRRFRDGTYTHVPWYCAINDHFPHIIDDKGTVAYTPNEKYGEQDRKLKLPMRRYLRMFVTKSNDDIARYCAPYEKHELRFAKTPKQIAWVYMNGPPSCMAYEPSHWHHKKHPTEAYGAGDLAIAWIGTRTKASARVLCWPEKKAYGRIYGDGGYMSGLLRDLLRDAGYIQSYDRLTGARLGKNGLSVLHIDGGLYVRKRGTKFVLSHY